MGGQYASERRRRRPLLHAGADRRLGADPGFSSLEFRLTEYEQRRRGPRRLRGSRVPRRRTRAFKGFSDLPALRKAGSYPGKDFFDQIASLMTCSRCWRLLSALVLVANTMTTLIGEQRREIGMMKAIGGTRRQIRRVYLRTALLLGAAGSVTRRRARGRDRERDRPLLRLQLLRDLARLRCLDAGDRGEHRLGVVAPPLAALPAIRRGARIPRARGAGGGARARRRPGRRRPRPAPGQLPARAPPRSGSAA